MPYIGTSPSNGVRKKFTYTATAGQTSFSGNDDNGISLVYTDTEYLDVYQNGVKLVAVSDYASTTGTSVVLTQGASVSDIIEIIAFDVFSVADTVSASDGGSFGGNVGMGGTLTVTGNADLNGDLDVDGTTNLDVVDIDGAVDMASTLQVDGAITSSAAMTITTADNSETLTLVSTDADASLGPMLSLYRNSSSPADSDTLGRFKFIGRNDNNQDWQASAITIAATDVSDGTEDAKMDWYIMNNGAETLRLSYQATETVFNDAGADIDFRIEGDSLTNLFVCDAGQEAIAMGDANPTRHSKATRLLCYNGSGTTGDFALHVGRVGTGAESQVCFSNGYGEVGSIKTNGTATSFNTSSDYRLKENVVTEWDATTRLKQLKPSRFNFKTDADKTVDGFLAHEVSSIVPEAINGEKDATQDIGTVKDADGNVALENVPESRKKDGQTWTKTGTENLYQDIDQSKLVPLLVKSLQEALAEIDTLKTKVAALESK